MSEEFAKAFLAAQKEFPTIAKTKTAKIPTKSGGEYSYTYADLTDVLDAVRPVLHNNGLSVAQAAVSVEGGVGVETRLYHTSGHVEVFGPVVLPSGGDARAAGSAITYSRRYSLCAALGIAADEDTDGAQPTRPDPQVEQVDLADVIRVKVAVFSKWSEEERKDAFKAHAVTVFGDRPEGSRPRNASEVDQVVKSMAEAYYEEHEPTPEEAPF